MAKDFSDFISSLLNKNNANNQTQTPEEQTPQSTGNTTPEQVAEDNNETFDFIEFLEQVRVNHESLIAEKDGEIQQLKNTLNTLFKQAPVKKETVTEPEPETLEQELSEDEQIEKYVSEYLESDNSLTNRMLSNYTSNNNKEEN